MRACAWRGLAAGARLRAKLNIERKKSQLYCTFVSDTMKVCTFVIINNAMNHVNFGA